jgi:hypothetical protein
MPEDDKTDPNRYYYRPGTTEPELRPEIAEAEAQAAKGVVIEQPKAPAKAKAAKPAGKKK